jgi:threonine synthase
MKMGLNVNNFIAATNINDTIPRYFKTGKYTPKKTIRTISNAMDVSDPNNFPRIEHIFDNNFQALKNKIRAEKVNEEETKDQIKKTYSNSKYVLDPHGAVGLVGLSRYNLKNEIGIFLETAHPIKFRDSITEILDVNIDDPLKLTKDSLNHKIALKNNYSDLVEFVKQSQ